MSREALTEAVLRFVEALPVASVERIAKAVVLAGEASRSKTVVGVIPHPDFRRQASSLIGAWGEASEVPGAELAAMLRAAAAARAAAVGEGKLEVVWTGPGTSEVPSRSTEAVVLEVVSAARHQLLLVTYAAFRYPPLVAALESAAAREVRTQVLVETRAGAGSLLGQEPAVAFAGIPELKRYHWPPSQRSSGGGSLRGRMHTKLVVADRDLAFVTSANLTGNGIEDNLECGLLVRGGPIPGRLLGHVGSLVRRGVFQPLVFTTGLAEAPGDP